MDAVLLPGRPHSLAPFIVASSRLAEQLQDRFASVDFSVASASRTLVLAIAEHCADHPLGWLSLCGGTECDTFKLMSGRITSAELRALGADSAADASALFERHFRARQAHIGIVEAAMTCVRRAATLVEQACGSAVMPSVMARCAMWPLCVRPLH